MGLKTLVRNLARLSNWDVFNHPGWEGGVSGGSVVQTLDAPGARRPAESVLMVYACIVARREAIGNVPMRLMAGDDNEIKSGPLKMLLDKPNNEMTWGQYLRCLETYLALYNSFVVWMSGKGESTPDELIPLSPAALRPNLQYDIHGPTGTPIVRRWDYNDPTTGQFRSFASEELMMCFGFNPHAPLSTLSPMSALSTSVAQDITSRESNLALQKNDGTPNVVLEGPQGSKLSKEQADEIELRWLDRHGGWKKRGTPAMLWGGLTAKQLGVTPKDMEYLDGLRFLRTDYYIAFRVFPAMVHDVLGETGLSQGSSTDQQSVAWWETVGTAELNLIAEIHKTKLIAPYFDGDIEMSFDVNAIPALVRHRLSKTDQATKLIGIGYKPDDVSEYLDLKLPEHPDNEGRVAFNQQVIGPVKPGTATGLNAGENQLPQKGTKDAEGQMPTPAADMPMADMAMRSLGELEALVRDRDLARENRSAGKRAVMDKFLAPREKAAAKRWSRFFIEQRDRVLGRIADLRLPNAESGTARDLTLVRDSVDESLGIIFPMADENMSLVARIRPLIAQHMNDGAKMMADEVGLAHSLTVEASPALAQAVEDRVIQAKIVNETTVEDLRGILRTAFESGETTAGLSDMIAQYYNDNCVGEDSVRPTTAAMTQTSGIVNDAQMIEAREVGGLKKYWIHGNPKEAREEHVAAARTYDEANAIGLDEKFVVGGEEMDAPGDSEVDISNVANCTCTVGFVKG
jgi:phage portal protein BeeE